VLAAAPTRPSSLVAATTRHSHRHCLRRPLPGAEPDVVRDHDHPVRDVHQLQREPHYLASHIPPCRTRPTVHRASCSPSVLDFYLVGTQPARSTAQWAVLDECIIPIGRHFIKARRPLSVDLLVVQGILLASWGFLFKQANYGRSCHPLVSQFHSCTRCTQPSIPELNSCVGERRSKTPGPPANASGVEWPSVTSCSLWSAFAESPSAASFTASTSGWQRCDAAPCRCSRS